MDKENTPIKNLEVGGLEGTLRGNIKESSSLYERILTFAKRVDHPFCFKDFCPPHSHSYVRKTLMRLKEDGKILPLARTRPRFYILKHWEPRYRRTKKGTDNPIGVKVFPRRKSYECRRVWTSFSAFLESLPAEDLAHVHDVHLFFSSANFGFVNEQWEWEKKSKCWRRNFTCRDGWGYSVGAYATTRTVTVSVQCKFYYSVSGLLRLTSLLGEIRVQLGDVPDPGSWTVSMWHYGKDFPCTVRGVDFEVCFETLAGTLARIYFKNDLATVRFEEVQTPNKSLQQIFEEVMKR